MTVLGIVAEYDPFHNGHLFHINEAKKRIHPDFVYVVLSPCLKQRGSLALLSPLDRASLALKAGADAVFCLPVLWTVRDAEHYALGAVSLLSSLGATHLAFGTETNNLALIQSTAELLESQPAGFRAVLKSRLSHGEGYPAALSAAAASVLPAAGEVLRQPNNVLAVCYARSVLRLHASLHPVPIQRAGNYHSQRISTAAPSSTALRTALQRGNYSETYTAVPSYTASLIHRRFMDRQVPSPTILDNLLLSRLRAMSPDDYARLPDLSEGLENALRSASRSASSRQELIDTLTCSRYPAARISRLCAHALLHISNEELSSLPLPENALLLGLRRNQEMTARWKHLSLPVISSFTDWKKAAHPADLAAWRLWTLCSHLPDTWPFSEKTISL